MAKSEKISEAVVRRLPIYLRYLSYLQQVGVTTVSSQQMGKNLDVNPAQIRKDLSSFGDFGKKGIGYDVNYLVEKIRQILKLSEEIRVALIGAGHLGHAISNYNAQVEDYMRIAAIFDNDPAKCGKVLAGITIQPLEELIQTVKEQKIRLAILTVPAAAAQSVANLLFEAGIEGILNFAPTTIRTERDVRIHYADVTSSLQSLAYYLT
ncbi:MULTISPECIES: redox-sensing transcriptional repressor Rex [Brevibacillus]|uniref:Redox-sensing transcriptional repressor Rex n=1 Tax=Brevibacillus borstelensis AK1 TaxID=1300222 RepID=M8E2P2_9BACL|nr:redox-sensing transcriptional repressor Rex [Brevibacillus borstelensis]EMT53551.1 redox-sensing transcriptional repressor Rex [Brevibacillus borstelensis AK1]KKX53066.1 REX family transcriptional regulator [Brevibacillus borstelensis cifa_chp40]MBE5397841.1 redox-sensing transcriptional repressor Rex [Brevibacillus borstelensis]MCC0562778.1 redox-sensing transcriptional repressor Rex [Brevibacillus borstelensis]MCM3469445.1 redox-sensing transcriptional repressor Rex [Brevibacillus borstel